MITRKKSHDYTEKKGHDYERTLGCQFGYLYRVGTNLGLEISFRDDSISNHDTQRLCVAHSRVVTQGTIT